MRVERLDTALPELRKIRPRNRSVHRHEDRVPAYLTRDLEQMPHTVSATFSIIIRRVGVEECHAARGAQKRNLRIRTQRPQVDRNGRGRKYQIARIGGERSLIAVERRRDLAPYQGPGDRHATRRSTVTESRVFGVTFNGERLLARIEHERRGGDDGIPKCRPKRLEPAGHRDETGGERDHKWLLAGQRGLRDGGGKATPQIFEDRHRHSELAEPV